MRRTDWYVDELTNVLMKHTAVAHTSVGFVTGTHEQPLVFSTAASDAMADLLDKLASWVKLLWDDHALKRWVECYWCAAWHTTGNWEHLPLHEDKKTGKRTWCAGVWRERTAELDVPFDAVECARWLLRHRSWVCACTAADDLHDELSTAYRRAYRLIDLPPERFYAGPCDHPTGEHDDDGDPKLCGTHLWGRYDRATVTCPACDTEHDVTTRRSAMLRKIEHQTISAPEISRLLAKFGIELPASTIRGYAQHLANRGKPIPPRIKAVDKNAAGSPVYRVRDVLDVFFRNHDKDKAA